jgi:hypothetical protein
MIADQANYEAIYEIPSTTTLPLNCDGSPVSQADILIQRLCSSLVQPEDAASLQRRSDDIQEVFKPQNGWHEWNVARAAVITLRIEHTERTERRVREKIRLRAMLTWDDDRRFEAEMQGKQLARDPAVTVEILRRTPQGCDWLINRWTLLAYAADYQNQGWTPEQTSMAFDLLGTPAEFRNIGKPGAALDVHGRMIGESDDSADVARRTIDELLRRKDVVARLDQVKRAQAEADMDHNSNAELKSVRRYESVLHNRLRWVVRQIGHEPNDRERNPYYAPVWELEPAPPEKPEPKSADEKAWEAHDPNSFSPPFCLTEDEFPPPGQKADIPQVLKSRTEKKLAKAETRRQADRRKAEKLYTS